MANILYRGSSIPGAVNPNTGANRALTNLEIDQNFYSLNRDKFETAGGIVSGATTFSSTVTINGDLTVHGTTTTINATTLTVDDINIELGSVGSPTNLTAEGGGITLRGATNKTFYWTNANNAWNSSEHIALSPGKNIYLYGSSSGVAGLTVPAAAGNPTITFQTVTGTVAHLADIGNGTITVNTSTGLTGSGFFTTNQGGATTVTLSHADTSSVADIGLGTNNFINGESYDTFGHVLSRSSGAVDFTVPDNYAFRNFGISTNSGFTFGAANANNIQAADSSSDTLTFVNGGAINIYGSTTAGTDAILIEHADTSSVGNLSSDNSGNTYIQDISFGFDTYGHVTSASVSTGTVPSPTLDSVTTAGFHTRGSSGTIGNGVPETPGLEILGAGGGNASFMTFHRPSSYAIKLGLDTDNQMKIGGWSAGSNAWLIWHSGNLTNLNQLSNGPGYITGYTETDTLATVTARGASTSTSSTFQNNVTVGANLYLNSNYGSSIVGAYDSNKYQGIFAMGDSYKLALDGSGPGTLYGLAWAFPGNRGGPTANLASHGILLLENGVFKGAWGGGSLRTPTNVYSPIYYDYNNSGYYADLDGTTYCYYLQSATTVRADSDRRIKDNIETIENGLDKVLKLRGTSFTRTDLEDKTKKYIGLIAQEVLEVLPEVVSGSEETRYSVGYGEIVSVLIEAIKELNAKVDDLQKQLVNK